jgi:isopenicillin-N N-acyltransferase-like protein
VRRSVEAYAHVFAYMTGLDWDEVREMASAYLPAIEAFEPKYVDEMRGLAEGSSLTLEDILAINVRTEVMYAAKAREAADLTPAASTPGECTGIAVLPSVTDSHHTLAAQNWDWLAHTADTTVVLEAVQAEGPAFVTVVEAGLLAKMGFNSAGFGLLTNALVSDQDVGVPAVPFHICLRALLDARTLPDALNAIQRAARSSSANYMLVSRDGLALDVEARPGAYSEVTLLPADGDILVHTNHFLQRGPGWSDVGVWWMPDSPFRYLRVRDLLSHRTSSVTVETLQTVFSDHANHPLGVCAHPDLSLDPADQYGTIVSVIMDLDSSEMWLADGNPCERPFRRVAYDTFFSGAS